MPDTPNIAAGMTTKRERQRANRALRRERELKEAQRKRRLKLARRGAIIAVLVIGGGLLFSQLFGGSSATTTTTSTVADVSTTTDTTDTTAATATTVPAVVPDDYAAFRAQETACGATAPDPPADLSFTTPGDEGIAADATVTATISTSCGDIVVDLDPAAAPQTVNSFVYLARQGFYDGTVFHRVVPGFVIQGGDPTGTGGGGPGYVVPDEFPAAGFAYDRGVVAMANSGPESTGSQFFIVTAATQLPAQYTVLGTVASGIEVADRISEVPLATNPGSGELSVPLESVYIEQVTIAGS